MFNEYVLNNHRHDLNFILKSETQDKHYSIFINFVKLFEQNALIGNNILKEPITTLAEFEKTLLETQETLKQDLYSEDRSYTVKNNVHVRIFGLPACPELHRTILPTSNDVGLFLQISGTVVRATKSKILEYRRAYICLKCKHHFFVEAEFERKFAIPPMMKCLNPVSCNGKNIMINKNLAHMGCKDYQEIKINEQVSKLKVGAVPSSMWIVLEDDLVDSCKPGDDVTICGVVMRRWKSITVGKKLDIEIVIRANFIEVSNNQRSVNLVTAEIKSQVHEFWDEYKDNPLAGRDIILKSICPQIYGLYLVKLAVAVILAGGSSHTTGSNGMHLRSESHLLLVGDPGTCKSQMLRFASKIIPRAVLTTGIGTTSAGLTVTAVMEDGEWQLDAGALVLADEGICCIDELNTMKERDRVSIHEAMEQQTISVAKAGIVCKLNTRCSILAATNPKGNIDPTFPLNLNVALPSPLLSRFDLVLILRDTRNSKWDNSVCEHIFNQNIPDSDKSEINSLWNVKLLKAYYILIKKLHPVLTNDANYVLRSYYQAQRQAPVRNASRTTVRLLDSLIRLSQAHARIMFRSTVLVMDAIMAIALVEYSMEGSALLLPTNVDSHHSTFPDNPIESYIELLTIILSKLNLNDLLKAELEKLRNNSNDNRPKAESPKKKCTVVDASLSQIKKIIIEKNDRKYQQVAEIENIPKRKNKRKNNSLVDDINKRSKTEECSDLVNGLQLLNMIPSVTDTFSLNLDNLSQLSSYSENIDNSSQNQTSKHSSNSLSTSRNVTENDNINNNSNTSDSININSFSEFEKRPIVSSTQQNMKHRNLLEQFKFKPTKKTVTPKTDSQSVISSKCLFQSQDNSIDDFNLDL